MEVELNCNIWGDRCRCRCRLMQLGSVGWRREMGGNRAIRWVWYPHAMKENYTYHRDVHSQPDIQVPGSLAVSAVNGHRNGCRKLAAIETTTKDHSAFYIKLEKHAR
jgi:hypothetical protein